MSGDHSVRTCVGCGETKPKSELLRLVGRDRSAAFDESGKMRGRGAYICPKRDCLDAATNKNRLGRALRLTKIEGLEDLFAQLGDKVKHQKGC